MSNPAERINFVGDMIQEWNALREVQGAVERAAHADVTDALGRTWTWVSGELYRHDSMAWPLEMVLSPLVGWPAYALLRNPNYQWCDACRAAMEQARAAVPPAHPGGCRA